jgi:hypothetical protein
LFGWRRAARRSAGFGEDAGTPRFAPAVVESATPEPAGKRRKPRRIGGAPDIIEMKIGGVMVRVGRGAEAKVIHALKTTP